MDRSLFHGKVVHRETFAECKTVPRDGVTGKSVDRGLQTPAMRKKIARQKPGSLGGRVQMSTEGAAGGGHASG
jgi:hypothetical protein